MISKRDAQKLADDVKAAVFQTAAVEVQRRERERERERERDGETRLQPLAKWFVFRQE